MIMKASIHPEYGMMTATCNCGHVIKTRSTLTKEISIDVCSHCHPFYTGQQKLVDTAGRIEKFKNKYKSSGKTSAKPASNP